MPRPFLLPLFTACGVECLFSCLQFPPTPCLEVCSLGHGERRREAREEVAVILAIGPTLRAHEVLGRPDALPGFLEVVHRPFENGVFVGHDQNYTDRLDFLTYTVFEDAVSEEVERLEVVPCRRCADSR